MGTAATEHGSHPAGTALHAARLVEVFRVSLLRRRRISRCFHCSGGRTIETVGGLMLALGIYTRWVAFCNVGEMAVAFFIVRNRLSVSFFPAVNGGQLDAVYSIFFFMFFLVGGGASSLDQRARYRNAPSVDRTRELR
jgi:uncharacterized membrane protein YphA (DoxX/SURF4 family)